MSRAGDEVSLRLFLSPAEFIDSDDPLIRAKAAMVAGSARSVIDKARLLFTAVRDEIRYDPPAEF